ncbi:uroporphyrinogen-III synthase [Mesorhizobium sp. CAU 1732]|uniref:uroporphyrinogen-III synthase n=1 Tax=Mesorhizobium sp. CAU 1732 TaxID=3140358 RepID=UPI00325FE5F4
MKKTVLVTRPEPGASASAGRLIAMGFAPIVLPLTRIVTVTPPEPIIPHLYQAVVVTSANAVHHTARETIEDLLDKPLFAVGASTAEAARSAGFTDVRVGAGTARDLATLITLTTEPSVHILHLAGTDRTPGFENAITASGRHLTIVETYTADKISYLTDFIFKRLKGAPLDHALVFSTRAGQLLAELVTRADLRECFERTTFLCISEHAARPLAEHAGDRIAVSNQPTENGVMLLLSADGRA